MLEILRKNAKRKLRYLKYSFNYLTGKQFQTVVVKNCSRSASANQKQEKSHCGPSGE